MKMKMKCMNLAFLSAVIVSPAIAQEHHVVPDGYAASPGTASFIYLSTGPRTYQMLIHEDQLADQVGLELTGVTWRLPGAATANWPVTDATFSDYDIYLGPSVAPEDRSLVFEENLAGPQTQVRSGPLVVPAGSFTFGSTPNAFGMTIDFDEPWLYTGGHLLVEIRHTGHNATSRSVDAIGTSTTGYGTQFSALWQSSFTPITGLQGNFIVTRFTVADDAPKCEPPDFDCDGSVGVSDLLFLLSQWGQCADCDDCPADLDGDCQVGVSDLLNLLSNWG